MEGRGEKNHTEMNHLLLKMCHRCIQRQPGRVRMQNSVWIQIQTLEKFCRSVWLHVMTTEERDAEMTLLLGVPVLDPLLLAVPQVIKFPWPSSASFPME